MSRKMVYKPKPSGAGSIGLDLMINPKEDEVVTVIPSSYYDDSYCVLEYPNAINGEPQSFGKRHFLPLDEYLDSISIEAEIAECLTIKESELV